jgi:hypothetical protein
VIEPGARVGEAFGFEAPEVADGALEANRRRMQPPDGGEATVFAGDAEHAEVAAVVERHVHVLALGPQTEQRPLASGQETGRVHPSLATHDRAWPRRVVVDLPATSDRFTQLRRCECGLGHGSDL